jgi:hypothetical protein
MSLYKKEVSEYEKEVALHHSKLQHRRDNS